MRPIASHCDAHTKLNTSRNVSEMDNGSRPNASQATEEELAASEYELLGVESLILHLNNRKQLLLERISSLNKTIQL
jgi:hypothetical protein